MSGTLAMVAILWGIPCAAGIFMMLPRHRSLIRWIGFGVVVLTLWLAVILVFFSPSNVTLIDSESLDNSVGTSGLTV